MTSLDIFKKSSVILKFALFRKIPKFLAVPQRIVISHSHRLSSCGRTNRLEGASLLWVSAYKGIGEKLTGEEVELQFRLSQVSANQAQEL